MSETPGKGDPTADTLFATGSGLMVLRPVWADQQAGLFRGIDEHARKPVLVLAGIDAAASASVGEHVANHAAICRMLGPGDYAVHALEVRRLTPGRHAVVMADVPGETLTEWRRRQPGAVLEARQWLLTMLACTRAVAAVHRAGIVIQSLCPARMLVQPDHTVALTDFRFASRMPREIHETVGAHVRRDTLPYMAPEQTGRMSRGIDPRSDLYSLGCIAFELLSGAPPFTSDDPLELVHAHLARLPALPGATRERLPEAVCAIVEKLLAKEPADRYQSAAGLQRDLEHCLDAFARTGTVDAFALDQGSAGARLLVPERLYGRGAELDRLTALLDEAAADGPPVVLIEGPSGIGKTALIRELRLPVAQRHGLLVQGKFEQYRLDIPYLGMARTLRHLVRWLVQLPETTFRDLAATLCETLGDGRHALAELEASLQRVFGPCEAPPPLPPAESRERQVNALRTLLRTVCSPERPVLLLLDDVQWADPDSMRLLAGLVQDRSIRGLTVVMCLRPDEIVPGNPVRDVVAEIAAAGIAVHRLTLAPLARPALAEMIAASLGQPAADVDVVALLAGYSGGNPLFLLGALEILFERGLLRYVADARRWSCDVDSARLLLGDEDITRLLGERLGALPAPVAESLACAAVIGSRFHLRQVAALTGLSPEQALAALRTAAQAGLVDVLRTPADAGTEPAADTDATDDGRVFGFRHDRVQQAAYARLDDGRRRRLHRAIGLVLLAEAGDAGLDDAVLRIVGHLNQAMPPPEATADRRQLARLDALAARRALLSNSWATAARCAATGIDCLAPHPFAADPALALDLHTLLAEAAALDGDLDTVEGAAQAVATCAAPLDRVAAQKALILARAVQGRLPEAIDACRAGLAWLDVDLPASPAPRQLEAAFDAALGALGDRDPLQLVTLPAMTDRAQLAVLELYGSLIAVAYIVSPPLFAWMILTAVARCARHGNAPEAAFFYGCAGIILLAWNKDVALAERFAQLALTLGGRSPSKAVRGRVLFVVGATVSHFSHPFDYSLALLQEARPLLLEAGELEFAGYANYNICQHLLLSGRPLGELEPVVARCVEELAALKLATARRWNAVVLQFIHDLTRGDGPDGETAEPVFAPSRELPRIQAAEDHTGLAIYHINALLKALLFDVAAQARTHARDARANVAGLAEFPAGAAFVFLETLALLRYPSPTGPERDAEDALIAANRRVLDVYARSNPLIFAPRAALVDGMALAAEHRHTAALAAFDRAIDGARDAGMWCESGLAAEAAATVARAWRKEGLAGDYRRLAYAAYRHWGAGAVAARVGGTDAATGDSALDLGSLRKVTRLLASELRITELPGRLLTLVLENAGATLAALVYRRHDTWLVQQRDAAALTAHATIAPLDGHDDLPRSILNEVLNTRRIVLANGTDDDARLAGDPCLRARGVRSLLALPVQYGEQTMGALYLENSLVAGAFPPGRVETLSVLCAQAAISLQNALLVSDLRESESRLRAIVDNNIDIITLIDRDGLFTFASPAITRLLGYAQDELLRRHAVELVHPDDQAHTLAVLHGLIEKPGRQERVQVRFRHRNGEWRHIEAVARNLFDVPGVDAIVVNTRDVTDRKRAEERVQHLAYHDQLTDVPNRALFVDRLGQAMHASARHARYGAVMFVDLDHFKHVNDVHGHGVGDQVLREAARRMHTALCEDDTVARFGGDEFVVLLSELSGDHETAATLAMAVAEKIRAALAEPARIDGQDYLTTASIGISLFPKLGESPNDLIREADIAMYRAKSSGRNTVVFFERDMQDHIAERYALERDLREAVREGALDLAVQSQVDETGRVVGAELLARWQHPVRGVVPPATFIPLAEEAGLIADIGEWVIREACTLLARWHAEGRAMRLAVNVSPRQFHDAGFVPRVRDILAQTGAPAGALTLEITENLLLEETAEVVTRMRALSALGVRFAIDDFGTGYSSLAYLKRLPLHELKIDKRFVQDVPEDGNDVALVETILSVARHLGFEVVAEGVESEAQLTFLASRGCTRFQGYFFHRPQAIADWTAR